jgi:hypothetical protein
MKTIFFAENTILPGVRIRAPTLKTNSIKGTFVTERDWCEVSL